MFRLYRGDVSAIDADDNTKGDQAFTVVQDQITGRGQILVVADGADAWKVELNWYTDTTPDLVIEVHAATRPEATDFVL